MQKLAINPAAHLGRQPVRQRDGQPLRPFDEDTACREAKNLHTVLTYQPADRYRTFQWLELGMYLLLALLPAGFTFWRIPRGLS